jgi:hypothetical protein
LEDSNMKKMGLFWFAAALLGAALIFSGCPTEAETETVTVTKGIAADVPALQKLLEEGVTPIRYIDDLDLTGYTVVIPQGITVNVDGGVELAANSVLGVVGGLTLGTGRNITGTGGVVAGGEAVLDLISTSASITPVSIYSSIADVTAALTDGKDAAIVDVKASELTAANVPAPKTLYVLGDLTVDSLPSGFAAGTVEAYGKLVIAASVDLATPTTLSYSKAILKNTAAATVTLPVTATLRGIDASAATLTVAATTTSLTIGDLTGTLALPATTLAAVTIDGGTGNVTTATAAITGSAATFSNTGTTSFTSTSAIAITPAATFTGAASFAGPVTFTTTATFDGTAVFSDDVTLSTGAATFKDTAFFVAEKKITLAIAASTIKLGPYAGLAVGTPASSVPHVYSMVIRNSGDTELTLTPAINTVLTFKAGASGKGITQGSVGNNAHSIAISGGTAALIPGTTYTVESAANKVGTLTIADTATLTLAAGVLTPAEEAYLESNLTATTSKLVLTGAVVANAATLTATGDLIAGATTINGTWKAVDTGSDTVTIAATGKATSSITASAATVEFTASTGGTITQEADADNNLVIGASTTIALGGTSATVPIGKIKLTQDSANPGKLTLAEATSTILTLAAKTPGGNYSTALGGITGFTLGSGITKTEVFHVGNILTKLVGTSANATLTASTTGSATNDIDSTTATTGT